MSSVLFPEEELEEASELFEGVFENLFESDIGFIGISKGLISMPEPVRRIGGGCSTAAIEEEEGTGPGVDCTRGRKKGR